MRRGGGDAMSSRLREFERERKLLSRNTRDPIVGGLRDKKENCSTRRGLRVGTGFREFLKLREVGVSPYLSFTLIFSVLLMFEFNEAVRGRLIGPKT